MTKFLLKYRIIEFYPNLKVPRDTSPNPKKKTSFQPLPATRQNNFFRNVKGSEPLNSALIHHATRLEPDEKIATYINPIRARTNYFRQHA